MGEKEYKNKVIFLRVSKAGNHLYAFDNDGVLNEKYSSLVMNRSDVEKLLEGKFESIKISAMENKNQK